MSSLPRHSFTQYEIKAYYDCRVPDLRNCRGEWRAPCPLHGSDHRKGSLAINKETGCWFCHSGCGSGGNIFEFEKRFSGCDYRQALENIGTIISRDLLEGLTRRNRSARKLR